MELKRKYKNFPVYINLTEHLPLITNKIEYVKHQTEKEITKLSQFGINMKKPTVSETENDKKKKIMKSSFFRHKTRSSQKTYSKLNQFFFSKTFDSNKTQPIKREKFLKKKPKISLTKNIKQSFFLKINKTNTNPNTNINTNFSNEENTHILKTEPKPMLTSYNDSSNIFETIDNIQKQCSLIDNACHRKMRNPFEYILRKDENKTNKIEVEELRPLKKKKRMKRVIEMKLKNEKLLKESDHITNLSSDLAYRANNIIKVLFDSNVSHFEETRKNCKIHLQNMGERKNKINELKKAIDRNIQENKKAHKIYDDFQSQFNNNNIQ